MTTDPMRWLQEVRKLDGALLAHMRVKATNHPQLGQAVAFPYIESGEAYAAKFRTVEKQWRSSQGKTRGLYNADALSVDQDQPIVITEGEIDALTVMQSGFARAVSLPDGWTEQGNKTEALVAAGDALRQSSYVVVAGDADAAGESLPRVVANILKGHDVRSVKWPEGCKDANDVLCLMGEGAVADCINRARRIDPPGGFITGLSDLPPLSDRRVLRGGHELIDARLAFELGAMSVATGTPGAGKSTFTTWVAHHVSKHERIRVGMLSFETHPYRTRDHLSRLTVGLPFDNLAGPQRKALLEDLDQRFRIVHRTYDQNRGHNLGWLESMIYALAVRDNCKLIIVDPWNELEHLPEPGESLTNYINFALQRIRQLAETLETHICLVAHPKKMDMTGGKPRAPLGYDIADSAAFSNKPSLGFSVHQDRTENGTKYIKIITWKVRDTQLYGIEKGHSNADFDVNAMNYTQLIMGDEEGN